MDKYHSEDITFCSDKKCTTTSCMRHLSNHKPYIKPFISVSDFKGTSMCPKHNKEKENE